MKVVIVVVISVIVVVEQGTSQVLRQRGRTYAAVEEGESQPPYAANYGK